MTDLPADRYIEEALRRVGGGDCSVEVVKRDYAQSGVCRSTIELARMIEKYEPIPEPVDPDLLIAEEVAASRWTPDSGFYEMEKEAALRAIKLARERRVL